MKKKLLKKEILLILLIIVLFLLTSYFSVQYESDLEDILVIHGILGIVVYIIVSALAIVVAPISTIPLLPLASTLWGSFLAAIFSIIGWTIGSVLAFILSRWLGQTWIEKLISLDKIKKVSRKINERNLFWSVVFFRMIIPVDVLSYALGLFTEISFRSFLLSTIIGISPFAFIFAYSVTLPARYQIIGGIIGLVVIGTFLVYTIQLKVKWYWFMKNKLKK